MNLIIPDKRNMIITSSMDPLKYYYMPFIKYFYRKRLSICLKLMGAKNFKNLLEIGYGSGIFFSSLNQAAENLYGIDLHDKNLEVAKYFAEIGIDINITLGDIRNMPYADNYFDCIVAISILEHIEGTKQLTDLSMAIEETYRVLGNGKHLYIGIPVKNWLMDFAFYYIFDFKELHSLSHVTILEEIKRKFKILKMKRFPSLFPFKFYLCIDAIKDER